MIRVRVAIKGLIILTLAGMFLQIHPSAIAGPQQLLVATSNDKQKDAGQQNQGSGSGGLDGKSAEMIVAELSDEQVRRLLIEELKKQTKQTAPVTEEETGALARLVTKIRFLSKFSSVADLRS